MTQAQTFEQWFDQMVERGRPIEDRQRRTLEELGGRTGSTVLEMKKLFEDTVEYETRNLLKRFGVMTRDDVKTLTARIDTLAVRVDELVASCQTAGRF
jgi:polyhydroxyalkanoate synthesis regulator phasin